jgi:predicted phosphoribosyltransferase
MQLPYRDRQEAGRALATLLGVYSARTDVLVLGLPRGGIPVAYAVALALGAPLDVLVVRKLGVPGHEELAMGAIASGGTRVLNHEVLRQLGIAPSTVEMVAAREWRELAQREVAYRDGRPAAEVAWRTVLVIDDGLATGSTMRAAVVALRQRAPARIVVAVPVAAPSTCAGLRPEVDELICAATPEPFAAVGLWYVDFRPVGDREVRELLARATERNPPIPPGTAEIEKGDHPAT